MEQVTTFIQGFATREVITVLALVAALFIGWKVGKFGWSAAKKSLAGALAISKNVGFVGVAASLFLLAGLGTAGLGVGELAERAYSGPQGSAIGFSNQELIAMMDKNGDFETVMQYAKERDQMLTGTSADLAVPVSFEGNPALALTSMIAANQQPAVTTRPLGQIWLFIGVGLAFTIMGLVTYVANKEVKD